VLSFVPRVSSEDGLAGALTGGGRKTTAGRAQQRLQRGLVISQLAVCVVLLTAAGLLVRTMTALQSVETGVQAENALALELPNDDETMTQPEKLGAYERIRERVAALPG